MIIEFGHFALILALLVAVVQVVLPMAGASLKDERMMRVAEPAAVSQFILLAIAFVALMHAYVTSDFSVANVAENSHSTKPLIYKMAGVWGNHEGSMLLWVLILALFGAAVALFGTNLPPSLRARVLSVQASIAVAFLLFSILTSNPFLRLVPAPSDGRGLNPILQDPALAFHPPFLYTGYVGFSIAFSFAIAALIEGRIDAAWARWVRPWTLAAWMFLTIGISMGSWWAYYELGWGGWWFWDPVENASFMPWLAGTALLHSALVMEKREALKVWTVLLAILTFSLSLMGTFIVRSGVLTSVHSFAVDPARGVFILAILILFTGGGLALFALRASEMQTGGIFQPISREGSLVLNNLLLVTATATVLVGTLYPMALEGLTGEKISVGPPFFDSTFGPLMIPLLLALPIGPMLAWKRGDLAGVMQRLAFAVLAAIIAIVATYAVGHRGPWLAPFGIGLGVYVMMGAIAEWASRIKLAQAPVSESFRRARNLPRSAYGTLLAHFGVGMLVVGIIATSAYREEHILVMKPGQTLSVAGYDVKFTGFESGRGPNYREDFADFDVMRSGTSIGRLRPSKRLYDAPPQPTTEAGIHASWRGDLYLVIGDSQPDGGYAVRAYFNPLVRFIWLGTLIMFLGGGISLSDRRLRIGVPAGRGRRAIAVPAE
ncbi:cytochrome c-type biogenesis protein CcmF [Hyphomicrobium denitrificans ATCC 51888]|uniref:Cytochrome c-type biogenesis protein CcmF n=1 Tax=Hyphomicrobium denitrificans (strain ATCC 51888 / DSM 1869 / NCIMB 11706 / TK 0415) TaxID=582899 RepID=D8JVQ6_HYPDA|nr:heme lyase CcmF/NrfE family subunit [Hyphomicrobium denitrificans]ADJ22945.1 cytochrome c-type biogenesis protein CcmF [Hyphomicrobium denitrificans ATCC 51888]